MSEELAEDPEAAWVTTAAESPPEVCGMQAHDTGTLRAEWGIAAGVHGSHWTLNSIMSQRLKPLVQHLCTPRPFSRYNPRRSDTKYPPPLCTALSRSPAHVGPGAGAYFLCGFAPAIRLDPQPYSMLSASTNTESSYRARACPLPITGTEVTHSLSHA